MNIKNLSKIVAETTGEPAYKIEKILNASFKEIRKQIIKAQIVKIKNFLTIYIDVLPQRNIYSFKEKRVVELPRKFGLKIVPSQLLKKEIDAKRTY
jgi:nucleoid DNA-binding protein